MDARVAGAGHRGDAGAERAAAGSRRKGGGQPFLNLGFNNITSLEPLQKLHLPHLHELHLCIYRPNQSITTSLP